MPHVLSLAERVYDKNVYAWMMPDESIMIGSDGWQWREGDCANRQPWSWLGDMGIGIFRSWSSPLNDEAAALESLIWETPYKPGIVMNGWWNKPGMFELFSQVLTVRQICLNCSVKCLADHPGPHDAGWAQCKEFDSPAEPSLGTMVHYLETKSNAPLGLLKGPTTFDRTGAVEYVSGNPDSYCGFLPRLDSELRTDRCGRYAEVDLDGCGGGNGVPSVGPMTNPKRRRDPHGRQTCVFSHSCSLTYITATEKMAGEFR